MAHNEIDIGTVPERVFEVLSDPRSFARWVVGSREIRSADRDWPAVGTAFDHKVGLWPITLSDHSEVLEAEAPHSLRLLVKARPFTRAYVTLRVHPAPGGSRVEMDEVAADARSRLFFNALTDPLVRTRNRESLRRLKALAERKEPMPTGELPTRDDDREAHVTASSRPAPS